LTILSCTEAWSGSDFNSDWGVNKLIDGITSGANRYHAKNQPGEAYVVIDFGTPVKLKQFEIWASTFDGPDKIEYTSLPTYFKLMSSEVPLGRQPESSWSMIQDFNDVTYTTVSTKFTISDNNVRSARYLMFVGANSVNRQYQFAEFEFYVVNE
jgi:hypothetical protein